MSVHTKRVYDDPDPADGTRVLVDRLWPRGVSKEKAQLDDWMKDVAPSDELREWFEHDPGRWDEFRERYRNELDDRSERVQELLEYARTGTLTLLYAATDEEHNNAVVLADYLVDRLDEG
ncbi:DUF488 domain-containing protein [Halosimplex aquaticum]|uniref:DUF488 domain-containing protein n=1 Tax=Halosimplex aquaticum TaxID=3026162 RepID=A0ABD5XXE0_9EURY|nr:DUF488 domain-containing protein [Halosimplex aquaticum]